MGACVVVDVNKVGLGHVSQLSDSFVKDPHKVVKAGDVVKVRVVEVDVARKRIGLSMKRDTGEARDGARERHAQIPPPSPRGGKPLPTTAAPKTSVPSGGSNAFADALKGKFGR